jgi:nitrite reductase (NADH) small subunit
LHLAAFVSIAKVSELQRGRGKTVSIGDRKIAVFNVNGTFYAIDNTCLHRGGPLGDGGLEGCIVVCPWHGWKYDVTTGVSTLNAAVRVACYVTRVEGEEVQVSC